MQYLLNYSIRYKMKLMIELPAILWLYVSVCNYHVWYKIKEIICTASQISVSYKLKALAKSEKNSFHIHFFTPTVHSLTELQYHFPIVINNYLMAC